MIHTVGPVWRGGSHDEDRLLAECYRNCLKIAEESRFKSIAFPAISCGVYGYPISEAVPVAVDTSLAFLASCEDIAQVIFVVFSAAHLEVYQRYLRKSGAAD